MSGDKMENLARRAVACDGWRLMAGMALVDGEGTVYTLAPRLARYFPEYTRGRDLVYRTGPKAAHKRRPMPGDILPDLTDPATLGCLLALVREKWLGSEAYAYRLDADSNGPRWVVGDTATDVLAGPFSTEAEALVAALEASGDDLC